MNNHIDQRMRQLMHELSDNAPTPNGWDEITIVRSAAAQRQSWWLVVATAAVAVVGVVAVGVAVIREPSAVLPDVVGTLPESPAPSTSATAAPRTGSSTTSSPTSTSPPTSPPGDVVAPIDVSYQEVPASLDLLAFATIGLPEGSRGPGALAPVAALDAGRAVVVDQETGQLIVVESSGVRRSVPLTVKYPPFLVTGGPGDVIYGIVPAPTTDLALAAIVAIPVTGDLAGTVVASESLSINPYSESHATVLGHGPTGIIDRRTGKQLLGYVDVNGNPINLDREAPTYTLETDNSIRDEDRITRWALGIERHPDYVGGYEPDPPPATLDTGRAIYWTALGPPIDPNTDLSGPTLPVVALLDADGSGSWYGLPDGWTVVASDLFGLIFARRVDATIELATPTNTTGESGGLRTIKGRYDCGPTDSAFIYASVLSDTTTSVVVELVVDDEVFGRSVVTPIDAGAETEIGFDLALTAEAFVAGEGLLRVRDLEAATAAEQSELSVTIPLRLPDGVSCG